MATYPSVTYSFTNGNASDATEVNTNFTDLVSGLSDGTKDINVKDITAVTITYSGHPKCRVYRGTSSQTLTNGADTLVAFNTETFDYGSAWNTGTYRFVAPSAGYYLIMCHIMFDSCAWTAGDYAILKVYKGGVEQTQLGRMICETTTTGYYSITGHEFMSLSATNYIDIYCYTSRTGGNTDILSGEAYNHLSIMKIA